ncbi:amidase [Natronorarus salvus]|uniref:amidase n=1 Tax=Natronorarus salvus TaxID=3117733 RepID=UPI002F261101
MNQRQVKLNAIMTNHRGNMIFDAQLDHDANQLRSDDITVSDYLDNVKNRFEEIEPEIQSFVEEAQRWERVQASAQEMVNRFSNIEDRPPLYGIPVGVKDIFHVSSLPTKANSSIPPEALTGTQAETVTKLKRAGALVLGKTVTTEFAYAHPGPTRNPHNIDHTPGGSSSGSAAAVASGLCPLALGTQTVGSVIRPAAFCGVVGFKPSFGRISMQGVIPYAKSLDHVGFFTQDIAGARRTGSVLIDSWNADTEGSLPRIGVPAEEYLSYANEEGITAFKDHIELLADEGFNIFYLNILDDFPTIVNHHTTVKSSEAALSHHSRFEQYQDHYSQVLTEQIIEGRSHNIEDLAIGRAGRIEYRKEIQSAMNKANVDIILSPPARGPAPEGIDDTGDPIMNLPWTYAGLPTATIPVDKIDGLPLGIQCTARFNKDEQLFEWVDEIYRSLS